jgi:hypothetical protein
VTLDTFLGLPVIKMRESFVEKEHA